MMVLLLFEKTDGGHKRRRPTLNAQDPGDADLYHIMVEFRDWSPTFLIIARDFLSNANAGLERSPSFPLW
jgi:hypothetical protein